MCSAWPVRFRASYDVLVRLVPAAFVFVAATIPGAVAAETVEPVFSSIVPHGAKERLTVVTVSYAPGGTSGAHRHAGSVFAYVLSGVVRSRNSVTGPARTYSAGESFFEPQGSTHLISANASRSRAAKMLVIFVAPDAARLTIPLGHAP